MTFLDIIRADMEQDDIGWISAQKPVDVVGNGTGATTISAPAAVSLMVVVKVQAAMLQATNQVDPVIVSS